MPKCSKRLCATHAFLGGTVVLYTLGPGVGLYLFSGVICATLVSLGGTLALHTHGLEVGLSLAGLIFLPTQGLGKQRSALRACRRLLRRPICRRH